LDLYFKHSKVISQVRISKYIKISIICFIIDWLISRGCVSAILRHKMEKIKGYSNIQGISFGVQLIHKSIYILLKHMLSLRSLKRLNCMTNINIWWECNLINQNISLCHINRIMKNCSVVYLRYKETKY